MFSEQEGKRAREDLNLQVARRANENYMWHIPLSVSERTIPHFAESYEEIEVFLNFFQLLDAVENENWCAKVDSASLDPVSEIERIPIIKGELLMWEDSFDEYYIRMEDGDVIDPNDFVAWLITQLNSRGTLYLERVARQYVRFIRSAPYKLNTPLSIEECNVFACESVENFRRIFAAMTSSSNFKEINMIGHGSFLAGLKCYERYLSQRTVVARNEVEKIVNAYHPITPSAQAEANINMEDTDKDAPHASLSPDERIAIEMVLDVRYKNRFRIDPIELGRLRRFMREITDADVTIADDELAEAVKMFGILLDGKVYIVSEDAQIKLKEIVSSYFLTGASVIFYTEFYIKNEQWLFDCSIVSVKMLTDSLRHAFPHLSFTKTYCGYTSTDIHSVVANELSRVWGEDVLLSFDQIAERLPYIPINRIKTALAYNADFIWNSVETYAYKNKIDVSETEKGYVKKVAKGECELHRYVSITTLPIEDFATRNHELSQTAVHNAVFNVYLSDDYEKRGKIVMRKGEEMDAHEIMREYCRTLDRITLDELLEFERDLTGEVHRWIPMQAGYDIMVRIDKDTYVAERFVEFDADVIDAAIEHFVSGEYAPLINVTTFATFPYCGQAWNLFLLESYVRRFSKRFRFETPSVNNKNVGCIVQRYSNFDYDGIMIDALAKSSLVLHDECVVADFLLRGGYRGSRQKAKIANLMTQAVQMREMRE